MPNPTISIITSVYNVRDFLPQAVQSVLAQTFRDFELLLVDDGSRDGSGALCDELARTDARIRVFHKENGGPASAANVGLNHARGEYVGFVNADDWAEPAMYETLYEAIRRSGARIAACCGDCIDERGRTIPGRQVSFSGGYGTVDAQDLLMDAFRTGNFYGPLSWNKLFDLRTFREKGVLYDETMFFGDDASVLHLVFEGERCCCLPNVLYHYRTRAGQITGADFNPRKLTDLRMYWDWYCYFDARPDRTGYADWAAVRFWRLYYIFWCMSGTAGNQTRLKPDFAPHKKHLDSILPRLFASSLMPLGEKMRAAAFCLSPTLFYRAAVTWGKLVSKKEERETNGTH